MAWCTVEDILAALPEADVLGLVDDEGAGTLDAERLARVDTAIAEAGSLVDAHVAGKLVGVLAVPDILRLKCRDLAVYNLYRRRFPTAVPDSVTRDYREALRLLEAIRDGKLQLGAESAVAPGVYRTNKTRDDRLFSTELLGRFGA